MSRFRCDSVKILSEFCYGDISDQIHQRSIKYPFANLSTIHGLSMDPTNFGRNQGFYFSMLIVC